MRSMFFVYRQRVRYTVIPVYRKEVHTTRYPSEKGELIVPYPRYPVLGVGGVGLYATPNPFLLNVIYMVNICLSQCRDTAEYVTVTIIVVLVCGQEKESDRYQTIEIFFVWM